jgi:hypothetical protein
MSHSKPYWQRDEEVNHQHIKEEHSGCPIDFSESDVGEPPNEECDVGRMLDTVKSETTDRTYEEIYRKCAASLWQK